MSESLTPEIKAAQVSLERVNELLRYDPEAGHFFWREADRRRDPSKPAGNVNDRGYVHIGIDGRQYKAHRLAWLVTHGEWPDGVIDHINRIPHDNRLCNLRVVADAENRQNQAGAHAHNKLGVRGVSFSQRQGRYQASISLNGKSHHLGWFKTIEGAESAYKFARQRLHPLSPEATENQ